MSNNLNSQLNQLYLYLDFKALPVIDANTLEKQHTTIGAAIVMSSFFSVPGIYGLFKFNLFTSPSFLSATLFLIGLLPLILSMEVIMKYKENKLSVKLNKQKIQNFINTNFKKETLELLLQTLDQNIYLYGAIILQEKRSLATQLLQDTAASEADKLKFLTELFLLYEKKESALAIHNLTAAPLSLASSTYHYAK